MTRRHSIAGLTLVELLIAMAIFGVVLTLVARLFVTTTGAYRVNDEQSELRQVVQAATELLQYEIGLAGYRCVDAGTLGRSFGGQPLQVTNGSAGASDVIVVRYHEDRFVDDPIDDPCVEHVVRFLVEEGTLYREVDGTKEAAVHGVETLQVRHWLNHTNSEFVVPDLDADPQGVRPSPASLAGIGLRLAFATEGGAAHESLVTVGLVNPQCEEPDGSEC